MVPAEQDVDREARAAIEAGGWWPYVGPHQLPLSDERLVDLEALAERYAASAYGPALLCGLAFGGRPESLKVRIEELERLAAEDEIFGFSRDCLLEAARLQLKEARSGYQAIVEGPLPEPWRAAIREMDPGWKGEKDPPEVAPQPVKEPVKEPAKEQEPDMAE
jgi:hypothetical protein